MALSWEVGLECQFIIQLKLLLKKRNLLWQVKILLRKSLIFLEVNLGLFADNSATYFFSKMPLNFGKYMGTTGITMKGKDLVKLGIADYFISSENIS